MRPAAPFSNPPAAAPSAMKAGAQYRGSLDRSRTAPTSALVASMA